MRHIIANITTFSSEHILKELDIFFFEYLQ